MQNITSAAGLKNAIQLLEVEQDIKGQLFKEQFYITYESFKPFNLLKSTLNDISSSPNLIDNILGTSLGLVTGFLSRKMFMGTSGNVLRKLIGSFLQLGVTNVVSKHSGTIKSVGQAIFHQFLRKREMNSEKP